MIINLFHRCFIKSLNLVEIKYKAPTITAFRLKSLFDCCLIKARKPLKKVPDNV